MEPWELRPKKSYKAAVAVPPAPVWVSSQRPLALNVTSVTSVANGKGDNELILGTVHRSPCICLTTEENPGKPKLGYRQTTASNVWRRSIMEAKDRIGL